jgi:origin recognition complex subunit 1
MPGTGKTATIRQAIRELCLDSEAGQIPPFQYIELNGMSLPDPVAGSSQRVSPLLLSL